MADDDKENSPFVPTAVKLGENSFPYSTSTSLNTSQDGADINNNATEDQSKTGSTRSLAQDATKSSNRRLARAQTELDFERPPMTRQFQTELSPPKTSMSKQGKGHKHRHHFRRQPTLTFDPYSSDLSSSSDDERQPRHTSESQEGRRRKAGGKRRPRLAPFSGFHIDHEDFHTRGRVSRRDGRLKLHINETVDRGYFAKTLGAGLKKSLQGRGDIENKRSSVAWQDEDGRKIAPEDDIMESPQRRVKLNVVIIVIGSRGDIQPFLRIGKILKEDYGHRVRIATHPAFKKFVEEDSGLEFFSVGGNPSELMAFMVKNPGLVPSLDTIKEGEIGKRRAAMYEMFQGMWRACTNSTDDETDKANLKMSMYIVPVSGMGLTFAVGNKAPFVADAIIANPPSFAPPHIAERLGIPLHMMFTYVPFGRLVL
jgi:hypothetical protein